MELTQIELTQELLENDVNNDDIINILRRVDNYQTSDSDIETLKEYVKNCYLCNDNVVNNYYILDTNYTNDILNVLADYYSNNSLNRLYNNLVNKCDFMNKSKQEKNDTIRQYLYINFKDVVKGIREDSDIKKMISAYLKINLDYNDTIIEKLQETKQDKYIVSISNLPMSQLTSTYTKNYSSCYNLTSGEYRASNIYLMGDNNNYIVKIFKYNDDNLALAKADKLKISNGVISRFNMYVKNDSVIVAKNYGDTSYYNNNTINHKTICELLIKDVFNKDINLINYDRYLNNYNYDYCDTFNGYKDYIYNGKFTSKTLDNYIVIGGDKFINWDIYCDNMIIVDGRRRCSECGDIIECDDDCYYCEDIDDYCCYDCCWYSDYDECWYSNNEKAVILPNGERIAYSKIEIE